MKNFAEEKEQQLNEQVTAKKTDEMQLMIDLKTEMIILTKNTEFL